MKQEQYGVILSVVYWLARKTNAVITVKKIPMITVLTNLTHVNVC